MRHGACIAVVIALAGCGGAIRDDGAKPGANGGDPNGTHGGSSSQGGSQNGTAPNGMGGGPGGVTTPGSSTPTLVGTAPNGAFDDYLNWTTLAVDDAYLYAGVSDDPNNIFSSLTRFPKNGGGSHGDALVNSGDHLFAGGPIAVSGSRVYFMGSTGDATSAAYSTPGFFDLTTKSVGSIASPIGNVMNGDMALSTGALYWNDNGVLVRARVNTTNAETAWKPVGSAHFAAHGGTVYFVRADTNAATVASLSDDSSTAHDICATGSGTSEVIGANDLEVFFVKSPYDNEVDACDLTTGAQRVVHTGSPPPMQSSAGTVQDGRVWTQGPWLLGDYLYFVEGKNEGQLLRVRSSGGSDVQVFVDRGADHIIGAVTADATTVYFVDNQVPTGIYAVAQ
jgi:hypothetical protein